MSPVPPDTPTTVVVDATVLIHLANARHLDLLGSLEGWVIIVPDQVEIALYADLRQRMGKGEAACLAMAATRGWMLASDDRGRAFRRLVIEHIGIDRLIDTARLVDVALEQGALSADEAQRINELLGS